MKNKNVIADFRVYPVDEKEFYAVYVWSNCKELRAHVKSVNPPTMTRDIIACVLWPYRRRPKLIGEIHFCKEYLDQSVISHEAAHAALEWARRHKLNMEDPVDPDAANEDEERFAEAVGTMSKQITQVLQHLIKN